MERRGRRSDPKGGRRAFEALPCLLLALNAGIAMVCTTPVLRGGGARQREGREVVSE